jgi:hypothetical protein
MLKTTIFLAIFLAGVCYGRDPCSDCMGFIGGTAQILVSEEEVASVIELLKTKICPDFADPGGCEKGVEAWYGNMMLTGIGYAEFPEKFCTQTGNCPAKVFESLASIHMERLNTTMERYVIY